MHRFFYRLALAFGLAVLLWVGIGLWSVSGLLLAMTLLMAVVYLSGVAELYRYERVNDFLSAAVSGVPETVERLTDWLSVVHPDIRHAVQQRVEAERHIFPSLALTPYLIGLLVMLGMLGTFLGMVVTFKGAVFALQDLANFEAARASLATPIRGLSVAFGTSVAGVGASAALGLMAALARQQRVVVLRRLDAVTAGVLYRFTPAHQREQTQRAIQQQADALPAVLQGMESLSQRIENRGQQLDALLVERQAEFHRHAVDRYRDLAASIDQSLRHGVELSARAVTDSTRPLIEQALAGVTQEASRHQEMISRFIHTQTDAMGSRFGAHVDRLAQASEALLEQQAQGAQQILQQVSAALEQLRAGFEERSGALLNRLHDLHEAANQQSLALTQSQTTTMMAELQTLAHEMSTHWSAASAQTIATQHQVLDSVERAFGAMVEASSAQADRSGAALQQIIGRAEELAASRMQQESAWASEHKQRMDEMVRWWNNELSAWHSKQTEYQSALIDRQSTAVSGVAHQLQLLRSDEARRGDAAVERLGDLQSAFAGQLTTLAAALEEPLQRITEKALEAPRIAADVLGRIQWQVDAMADIQRARDANSASERLLLADQTDQVLQRVRHTLDAQSQAVKEMVTSVATVLERTGHDFAIAVDAQTERSDRLADHASVSTQRLEQLAGSFHQGSEQLVESQERLMACLTRMEEAIGRSISRSDDQLAYYVAQAREVVDLSITAQQGIVEDLRRLRTEQRAAATPAEKAVK